MKRSKGIMFTNFKNSPTIAIVGTRGIPASYGGFETYAEELSVRLAARGFRVCVYCQKSHEKLSRYKGVYLKYSKYTKDNNPLGYYFDSLKDATKNCDRIIVTGVGGSIFYPLVKRRRVKIITNSDGIEHNRKKWSFLKKLYIKLSEAAAVKFSDIVIADSKGVYSHLYEEYNHHSKKITTIEYGAYIIDNYDEEVLKKYSLIHGDYYLTVCRLEPENNVDTILEGFKKSGSKKGLIIIGKLKENLYIKQLISHASKKIRFIDGVYDKAELSAIRFSCFAYLHGHSVGGTNPSLLEALGAGNITICHDNVFNREVTASQMVYFSDIKGLSDSIVHIESQKPEFIDEKKKFAKSRIANYYNWDRIVNKYIEILG